jgi:hypothetical protein
VGEGSSKEQVSRSKETSYSYALALPVAKPAISVEDPPWRVSLAASNPFHYDCILLNIKDLKIEQPIANKVQFGASKPAGFC